MPVAAPPPAPPVFEARVSPARAGTEASPKAARVQLTIEGKTDNARELIVYFPQGLRISNEGIADGTKAGKGSIVIEEQETAITPSTSPRGLAFAVGDTQLDGVFSQAGGRYTAKLRVKIPQPLRAFSSLTLDLKVKALFATRGCPLPFRVELVGARKRAFNDEAACRTA